MTTKRLVAACLGLLLATGTQASELSFLDRLELRNACRSDIEAACVNVEAGEGRLAQCIRDNADQLSQICLDTIARIRADFLEATDAAMDY